MRNRLLLAGFAALLLLVPLGVSYDPLQPSLVQPAPSLFDKLAPTLNAQGYSFGSAYTYWVPPGACNSTVSGNSTGTNGLTTNGASAMPVIQAQTSGSGTNTHNFVCNISPPNAIITTGNGIAVSDAVFFYGQQTALGTQVATLASGTMNSTTVFSYVDYPTAAASETASTVTPVRADSGTLTIAPAVASFNVSTTTAGAFYSVKFTPATPIAYKTDLRQLLLRVSLLNTATAATVTVSPGTLVHFRGQ